MSVAYDEYLKEHITNVKKAYEWLEFHLPTFFKFVPEDPLYSIDMHDESKYSAEEYKAYDEYFYTFANSRSFSIVNNFDKAWLHHIHNNKHHWQHWVLMEDDSGNYICIEMPQQYVVEMVADWWSFSWKSGDLTEIFDWYEKHKNIIKLNTNTRKNVEEILRRIKAELDIQGYDADKSGYGLLDHPWGNAEINKENDEYLEHHGILGMKWGKRNGPPYPLDAEDHSQSEKKDGWKKSLNESSVSDKSEEGHKDFNMKRIKSDDGKVLIDRDETTAVAKGLSLIFPAIRKNLQNSRDYTLKDNDGKKIGTLSLGLESKDTLNIGWISITGKNQGKGHAQSVMNTIINMAKDNNFKKITLEVPGSSQNARHIYEKLGFKETQGGPTADEDDIWGGLTYMTLDLEEQSKKKER